MFTRDLIATRVGKLCHSLDPTLNVIKVSNKGLETVGLTIAQAHSIQCKGEGVRFSKCKMDMV